MREKTHRLPPEQYRGERTVAFTACLQNRYLGFLDRQTVDPMIAYLASAATNHSCFIPVYCFMPDHLHVMFKGIGDDGNGLAAMIEFKHRSGLWMARKKAPFRWQKDFYDHLIRSSSDWRGHAKYIALNPVRAGLVENLYDYPFVGAIGTELSEILG